MNVDDAGRIFDNGTSVVFAQVELLNPSVEPFTFRPEPAFEMRDS